MTTTILQPRINLSIVNAALTATNTAQRILIVGQKTSAGSATAGALVEEIANGGAEDALFGEDSMLAKLVRSCKIRNQEVRIDAIPLDDNGSGVFATGDMDVAGTATEAGILTVIAGSERNHIFTIPVADTDTATIIGDAIEAAINADLKAPVNAVNTAGSVKLDAVNAGTYGNSIPLEIRGTIAGISTTVTGMSLGALDPVLTTVFDPIEGARYQGIVWPYPDDTAELLSLLDPRLNADSELLDGVGFTAAADSAANLSTLVSTLNSQSLVVIGDKAHVETNYAGPAFVEIPMVLAAIFAGYRGLRLDVGAASISDLVITANGPLDAFGGPALASKPYFNMPFPELVPMRTSRGFTKIEIESLFDNGVSVLGNSASNVQVLSGEIVTTYTEDSAGNPDLTFKTLNNVDTSSQSREFFFNNYKSRFSQSRLTEGDIVPGRDIVNALVVRAESKRRYQDLSGPNFVLTEQGEAANVFFDENLFIAVDKTTGIITVQMSLAIVTQVRAIIGPISITLSPTA